MRESGGNALALVEGRSSRRRDDQDRAACDADQGRRGAAEGGRVDAANDRGVGHVASFVRSHEDSLAAGARCGYGLLTPIGAGSACTKARSAGAKWMPR